MAWQWISVLFLNGKPQWNDNPGFVRIAPKPLSKGWKWGGDWKKFIDKPHVQLGGLTVSQCSALFKKGGLQKVG